MRLGGWTRIWIVISAIALVAASVDGMNQWRRDTERAQAQRDEIADLMKSCRNFRNSHATTPPKNSFDDYLISAFVQDCAASEKIVPAEKYEEDVQKARDMVVQKVLREWLWPTALIGIFFFAVGWVRKGFARKT